MINTESHTFDLFVHFILKNYNNILLKSEFPRTSKNANVASTYKKYFETRKQITDL